MATVIVKSHFRKKSGGGVAVIKSHKRSTKQRLSSAISATKKFAKKHKGKLAIGGAILGSAAAGALAYNKGWINLKRDGANADHLMEGSKQVAKRNTSKGKSSNSLTWMDGGYRKRKYLRNSDMYAQKVIGLDSNNISSYKNSVGKISSDDLKNVKAINAAVKSGKMDRSEAASYVGNIFKNRKDARLTARNKPRKIRKR
ncbi:hypothetical protein [Flammeovirga agarivorans]|uniref:Uncharacterized protein n=1 Tax=Flammeovirga agarivorans TaxID=2726742 RepID=A0A7X8SR45_9BACT|nr:hypothetical protein [Flammeovirga agarivorans]NLR94872.1 hypothetical protein [Flammeovirga agarivorans]